MWIPDELDECRCTDLMVCEVCSDYGTCNHADHLWAEINEQLLFMQEEEYLRKVSNSGTNDAL